MLHSQSVAESKPVATLNYEADQHDPRQGRFLQLPFVQNVLPFITSLSVHAGILIFGLLVYGAVKLVQMPIVHELPFIPVSELVVHGPPGGIPNVGVGGDPLREARQENDLTATTTGWADRKGPSVDLGTVGAPGEDAAIIGIGPLSGFGRGIGNAGGGHSAGTGPLAKIGVPGGGSIGPKGPTFGDGGNAHLIVFLCDATGSMINKMATLKDELNKTVVGLKPSQSFDIIFYQGEQVEPFAPMLIAATPQNKRKAGTYLEGVTATSTTDPIPALIAALKLKPQLMYFLTDAADFPDPHALLAAIKKYNPQNKTKINTILFVENKAEHEKNADSEGLMKQIATESGGNFRWVEMDGIQ